VVIHGRRRVVVGDVDHRVEDRPAPRVEAPVPAPEVVQVGDEQHRLHDARRDEATMHVQTAEAPLAVEHGERRTTQAALEEATG